MKGNKFLAALMAASMTFSVVPATAMNVFANEAQADVLLGAPLGQFTKIQSCSINGADSSKVTSGLGKTLYDAIVGATLAGTNADAVKSELQTAISSSGTVVSNTITSKDATSGVVVVTGSDTNTYTFRFSDKTAATITIPSNYTMDGKTTAPTTGEAKAIYDIIVKASITGSNADAIGADLQIAFNDAADGKTRTVISNSITSATPTSGSIVVRGSDNKVYALRFLASAPTKLSTYTSCAIDGTDATKATGEAKAIYDIITNTYFTGSTADDVKTGLQNTLDDAGSDKRTVKTNTITKSGAATTPGTVVVAGADGHEYTFAFSNYASAPMSEDEEAALSDLFAGITAITYSGNSITTNVVQTAFNSALATAKAGTTDAFFGKGKTGNGYTYTVDTATVSGDTVTGTLSRNDGTNVYHYSYSAAAVQNSDSEKDIVKSVIAQLKQNEYPSFGTDSENATLERTAVETKIQNDIKELVAGKANPSVAFGAEVEATHDDEGRIVATIAGNQTTLKLKHSSSEKMKESKNAIVKGLTDSKATASSSKDIYEKSDTITDVSNATNTYEFTSSSAFSRSLQGSTATTAVDDETVRAAVEKLVTDSTKDYASDGVTYSVETFDGYYGSSTGKSQVKATAKAPGYYVVKVTASIPNDFYGFDSSSVSKDATTTATYYVVVNTPKLKSVAVKSISLADKTYVRKQNYKYTYTHAVGDAVTVNADVIELKPVLTPEDANGDIKWTVTKTDGQTAGTDAMNTAANTALKDADGKGVAIADTDGKIIVTKAGTYKVTATAKDNSAVKATMTLTVKDNFNDVPNTAYFSDDVAWAYKNGITSGINESTFGSYVDVTRGQFVTWLYKYAVLKDSTVEIADSDVKSVFSDVSTDKFYAKAVQWAVANNITVGTSATTFSPDQKITRAQALTMLWRAMGSPTVGRGQENEATLKFTDLPSNPAFKTAVVWAVSKNITDGTTPTTCSPDNICPRSQAITFIHMANVKIFNGD